MILSSTGLVQSMTNVWLFFLPLPAGAAGFFVGATITAHRSAAGPPAAEYKPSVSSCQQHPMLCSDHGLVQWPFRPGRTGGEAMGCQAMDL